MVRQIALVSIWQPGSHQQLQPILLLYNNNKNNHAQREMTPISFQERSTVRSEAARADGQISYQQVMGFENLSSIPRFPRLSLWSKSSSSDQGRLKNQI